LRIFIIWSGRPSREIAQALSDWLPYVIHALDPFVSLVIEAGSTWRSEIGSKLQDTNFGLVCLTPGNLESRWINFEAGAVWKAIEEARIIPLLHNLREVDVRAPLSQFQMKRLDRDGVYEVVEALNRYVDNPLPSHRLRESFDTWWPRLQEILVALPDEEPQSAATPHATTDARVGEILEELLTTTRSIDRQINRSPVSLPSGDAHQILPTGLAPRVFLGGRFRLTPKAQAAVAEIVAALPVGRVDGWDYRDRELGITLSMDDLKPHEEALIREICDRHGVVLTSVYAGDP
jgi:hypothetical protein